MCGTDDSAVTAPELGDDSDRRADPTPAVGAFPGTEPQTSDEAVDVGAQVYQQ